MKKILLFALILMSYINLSAQLVARMEVKEDIPGICNKNEVYAIIPSFKGQEEAVCPVSKEVILQRLNAEVTFLKDKPKYKDKGMVNLIINCKGVLIKCAIDNKTQSPELDAQIVAVFNSLGEWKAGKLYGKEMDTTILYSIKIKKGIVTFD